MPTGEEIVDMVIFKTMLNSGKIDVDLFNKSFKSNMEDEDEEDTQ
jgi:hypothetical protein